MSEAWRARQGRGCGLFLLSGTATRLIGALVAPLPPLLKHVTDDKRKTALSPPLFSGGGGGEEVGSMPLLMCGNQPHSHTSRRPGPYRGPSVGVVPRYLMHRSVV